MDMEDISLSDDPNEGGDMEQTFSAAAGDPRIMLRTKLERDIDKLEASRHRHFQTIQRTIDSANDKLKSMDKRRENIAKMQRDYDTFNSTRPAEGEKPTIVIRGQTFTVKTK